jgi:hypothetical protein
MHNVHFNTPTATPDTLNSVWCEECNGYLACDVPAVIAQRLADRHCDVHAHTVWIDPD